MTDPTVREAIETTLAGLERMLGGEHAALAGRIRRARDDVAADPPGDLRDPTVRRLRRLATGTMGALSDVLFGSVVDGRWVPDDARDRRFGDLSHEFRDLLSRLPPSRPPDLYLVTDRIREGWLVEDDSTDQEGRRVEVQPPIWTGQASTSEFVVLRGGAEDGADVEIEEAPLRGAREASGAARSAGAEPGRGRVFNTREKAEAAVASQSNV